jgi:hypothetical protein
MRALEAMVREERRDYLKRLSRAVEAVLPPGPSKRGKCDFALVLSDAPGNVYYACNSRRRMTEAMRTALTRLERKRRRRPARIR